MVYFIGIIIAGCYGAYSLGANNVANVTGIYVGSGLLSYQAAALIGETVLFHAPLLTIK